MKYAAMSEGDAFMVRWFSYWIGSVDVNMQRV